MWKWVTGDIPYIATHRYKKPGTFVINGSGLYYLNGVQVDGYCMKTITVVGQPDPNPEPIPEPQPVSGYWNRLWEAIRMVIKAILGR
jgi:hypothetical protein